MFREYQDPRVKRNLKITKILSFVALILCGVCIIGYLFGKWYPYEWMVAHPQNLSWPYMDLFWGGEVFWKEVLNNRVDLLREIILDFFYLLYLPLALSIYRFSKKASDRLTTVASDKWISKQERVILGESIYNNDFSNTLCFVIISMMAPVVMGPLSFFSDSSIVVGIKAAIYHLGGMMPSYIFVLIANCFLIQNCVLIKREWKTDPPPFLRKTQQEAAEEAKKKKAEQDAAACKKLLDECGMLFFIEYYPQLKRLPIRDVVVSDHYFPERQVRLPAAKKIIDDGLTECALHYIIDTFGDVFSAEAIDRAKTILNEIESERGTTK